MNEQVRVLTLMFSHEVALPRGLLESEGIRCFTKNEIITGTYPFLSHAFGGIQLFVNKKDESKALDILQSVGYILKPSANKDKTQIPVSSEYRCPVCGSEEISTPRLSSSIFAISALILGFPLPFRTRIAHCYDCGTDFKVIKKKMP
jgi:hypothetical protein